MDRRWIIGLVGLALAGCVSPRPEKTFKPPTSEGSPFAALPPINETINGNPYKQPATKLATALPPMDAPKLDATAAKPPRDPGTRQASSQPLLPEPEARPVNLPEPEARPAPFAGETPKAARPQASPDQIGGGRSAPFSERQPEAPRPRATPISTPTARPAQASAASVSVRAPAPSAAVLPLVAAPTAASEPPTLPTATPTASEPPTLATTTPSDDAPPILPPTVVPTAPVVSASSTPPPFAPPADGMLSRTSMDAGPKKPRDDLAIVGRPAARVGDDIITLHQLRTALRERLETIPAEQRANLTALDQRRAADAILTNLIDRTLILQAAKRQLKDPKQLQMFYDGIEKYWLEREVAPLLKVYGAANVSELKTKMEARGKSYDFIHDEFRQTTLAQEYLMMRMKDKLTVALPEMRSYYYKHEKDFERPAQVTWREIALDLSKFQTRAEAKAKADQILGRLLKGEDFAAIAKKESHGATAGQGGLWETTPGSYGMASVNELLSRLPLNQVSPVIEAPQAFHIIKVEQRRNAGPARFDEVQDQVRTAVIEEKRKGAAAKFVTSLRERTLVTTMFDDVPSDPAAMKVNAPPR